MTNDEGVRHAQEAVEAAAQVSAQGLRGLAVALRDLGREAALARRQLEDLAAAQPQEPPAEPEAPRDPAPEQPA